MTVQNLSEWLPAVIRPLGLAVIRHGGRVKMAVYAIAGMKHNVHSAFDALS